jgi:hypothetical protein
VGSSRRLQDFHIFSRSLWIACGFAQMIQFVPIMNQMIAAVTGQPTVLPAMAAC